MAVAGSYGVVLRVITGTTIQVNFATSVSSGTYAQGLWQLFDSHSLFSSSTPIKNAPWAFRLSPCRSAQLDNSSPSIVYLARNTTMSLNYTVINSDTRLTARISNPSLLNVATTSGSPMQIVVSSRGDSGYSSIAVSTVDSKLSCQQSYPVTNVFTTCAPFESHGQYIPGVSVDTLTAGGWDTYTLPTGELMFEVLPVNYRPPSSLGYLIPTNSFIYNADPSVSRYGDYFAVAKNTGSFNQCLNATNKYGCKCSTGSFVSSSPRDTDCMERVVRILFATDFTPSIGKFVQNVYVNDVTVPFTIREINGRTDWCYACMLNVDNLN